MERQWPLSSKQQPNEVPYGVALPLSDLAIFLTSPLDILIAVAIFGFSAGIVFFLMALGLSMSQAMLVCGISCMLVGLVSVVMSRIRDNRVYLGLSLPILIWALVALVLAFTLSS